MKFCVFEFLAIAACSLFAFGQRFEIIAIEQDLELQTKIEKVAQVALDARGPYAKRKLDLAVSRIVLAANDNRQHVM